MPITAYRTINELITEKKLASQRVFLRADLNVPLKNGVIVDDYRLQALLPTLDLLLAQKATIILVTHLGRPQGIDAALSTQLLVPWFAHRGYTIVFVPDLEQAHTGATTIVENSSTIILLENIRFWPEEKTGDQLFAKKLAGLADYYVNDAFSALHRNDTSITIVPTLFRPDHRALGLGVIKELMLLNKLIDQPQRPFVLVIGGGKVADKISLMLHLLDRVDTILLCPAIVFSFTHAQGRATGSSLVDGASKALCLEFLQKARQNNVCVLFPVDYIVAKDTFNGPLRDTPVPAHALQKNMVAVTIGPETAEIYAQKLLRAHTIFVNGLMGSVARPETLSGASHIFAALTANVDALRITGGGDSVAAAQVLGLSSMIGHLSTGGGAAIAFISGKQLPGLIPFLR